MKQGEFARSIRKAKPLVLILAFSVFLGLPTVAVCVPPNESISGSFSSGDPIGGERRLPIPKYDDSDLINHDPDGQDGAAGGSRGPVIERPLSPFGSRVWIVLPGIPGAAFPMPDNQTSLWDIATRLFGSR